MNEDCNDEFADENKQTEKINLKQNLSAQVEGELDVSIAPPEELEEDAAELILGKIADD